MSYAPMRLPSASLPVVAWKPRSPTQCCAHACGQPSRCRRSSAIASPNVVSRWSTRSRRRSFVSPTEKLQCGSPVHAIEFAQISFVVERQPELVERGERAGDVGDAGDDQVLLARQADVAAERRRRDRRPRSAGRRTRARAARARRCSACRPSAGARRCARRVAQTIGGSSYRSSVRPSFASTRSSIPSAPMSSTMNLSRAFTRDMRYLRSSLHTEVTAPRISFACSFGTKTPRSRAMRGTEERPPPTCTA